MGVVVCQEGACLSFVSAVLVIPRHEIGRDSLCKFVGFQEDEIFFVGWLPALNDYESHKLEYHLSQVEIPDNSDILESEKRKRE